MVYKPVKGLKSGCNIYVTAGPVRKPFNQIIGWSARFKASPVYTKSKNGSIYRLTQSKVGPCMHWMACHLMCMVNCLSRVLIKATGRSCKTTWEEASQFFFMLILALLVSLAGETLPTPAWIAFNIQSVH